MLRKSEIFRIICCALCFGFYSCNNFSYHSDNLDLGGKWIYEDRCGNSLEVWFLEDSLIWYTYPLNELYRLEFTLENDSIFFSDTPYPTEGQMFMYGDYIWISPYPDLVYPFRKLDEKVENSEFTTSKKIDFFRRHLNWNENGS